MRDIYVVECEEQFRNYQSFVADTKETLREYLRFLREKFSVTELPNVILWTSAENATRIISSIPIPAYTNDLRTVFCPELESWRQLYLRQLDNLPDSGNASDIRRYYETRLTKRHLLQILGHEFVHHSDLFIEEAYEKGIWFEEGMCEYISRTFFLTEKEFQEEASINCLLVNMLRNRYGAYSLEDFGAATYAADYAGIFFEYWRSFLAVAEIIKRFDGNVMKVFEEYHRWYRTGTSVTLSEWFGMEA